MKRKVKLAMVLALVAVAWVGATEWLAERQSAESQVAWSPLYGRRVTEALSPLTAQVVYAGLQQLDTRAQCQQTVDCVSAAAPCNETFDCQETFDCHDTFDCKPTSDETCREAPTCEGWATCAGDTCASSGCTLSTFDIASCGGPTVDGPTCAGLRTCDVRICDWPTYFGSTCIRPTCDGPTCFGGTCEGGTCFLARCDVLDYGDAPEIPGTALQFATRKESDGARHIIDGIYYLGARLDADSDGQPTELAVGDDRQLYGPGDDEDGIWFCTTFNPGRQAVVIANASDAGTLFAWVDYDRSGGWLEEGDAAFPDGARLAPGYNWIVVDVPEDAVASPISYARFRFAETGNLLPTGEAETGEVEDYRVPISATFRAWVMTDEVLYAPGDPLRISFYVNEAAQVTLVRHRADGTADVLWTSIVEGGRHHYPDVGGGLAAVPPEGTTTVEMIATSLESGGTVWLTTPYQIAQ